MVNAPPHKSETPLASGVTRKQLTERDGSIDAGFLQSAAAIRQLQARGVLLGVCAMATKNDAGFEEFKARLKASREKFAAKNASTNSAVASTSETSNSKQPSQLNDEPPKQLQPTTTWSCAKPDKRIVRKQQQRAPDIQQMPPHSIEGEQGVLSSIMRDCQIGKRDVIAKVAAQINENFFFVPAHRTIFEMLRSLWRADRPIDFVAFTEFLKSKNVFEAVGGHGAINDIFLYVDKLTNFVPIAAAVDYYLEIVIERFKQREGIAAATKLVRLLYQSTTADEGGVNMAFDEIKSRLHAIQSLSGHGTNTFKDAATEIEKPLVEPPDVIKGVLHKGGKASLVGASKTYKTWLLSDLAISVATGSTWLNFETEKCPVLYVNCELPEVFFNKRIRKICDERQLTIEAGMLNVLHLRGRIEEWQQIQWQITQDKFGLIILDPIYKLLLLGDRFVRSENDAGPIALLLKQIEALAVRTGAAVMFGAHSPKGDQSQREAIDRISGHGTWGRDVDTSVAFTKHEDFEKDENEVFSVELTLRSHKPQEAFVVRWEWPLFLTDSTLDPSKLKKVGRKPDESKSADKVLTLLTKPMSTAEWKEAAETRGISQSTFYRRLDELEKNGKVELKDDVKWHQI